MEDTFIEHFAQLSYKLEMFLDLVQDMPIITMIYFKNKLYHFSNISPKEQRTHLRTLFQHHEWSTTEDSSEAVAAGTGELRSSRTFFFGTILCKIKEKVKEEDNFRHL